MQPQRLAFLLDNLSGGGAERVILNVAGGFSALGYEVDLLVCELRGELCDSIPAGVNVVQLNASGQLSGLLSALRAAPGALSSIAVSILSARKIPKSFRYLRAVRNYLLTQQPAVIFSALPKANICAVLSAASAAAPTRVFVGVQNAVSVRAARGREDGKGQMHHMLPLMRHCYRLADGVIAASNGVAEDAISFLGLHPLRVQVVYNPVEIPDAAVDPAPTAVHTWFDGGGVPVVLAIGRLVEQKNFPLLIRAFAALRQKREARLLILGGDASSEDQMATRERLQSLASELGVADDVQLPGYKSNPHDYLRRANLFVLSSRYEGFGNVLVEALLAGCPIVSTDCPSGPSEILAGGKFGRLVPMDDAQALADAMIATLEEAPQPDVLRERGAEFSVKKAVSNYQRLFFG